MGAVRAAGSGWGGGRAETGASARLAPGRTCASEGLELARWLATSRAAPTVPTTRGMSSSSKPGMPRVNRNTAKSSSCCAALGIARRAGARRGRAVGVNARAPRHPNRRAPIDARRGVAARAQLAACIVV